MYFDISAIQSKRLNAFNVNGLKHAMFFDTVEDTTLCPVTKAAVNTVPVAELFWKVTPATTVFRNELQGLKKLQIVYLDVATLFRKQMSKAA